MAKRPYLSKDKTGNYRYRRKVPEELRGIIGKLEFKRSLKTREAKAAISKWAILNVEIETELAAAYSELEKQQRLIRATKTLDELEPFEVERIALLWFNRQKEANQTQLKAIFDYDDRDYATAIENTKDTLAILDEAGNPHTLRWVNKEVDQILKEHILQSASESTNHKMLQQAVKEGLKELEEYNLKQFYKKVGLKTSYRLARNKRFKNSDVILTTTAEPLDITLSGLIQKYLNDPKMKYLGSKALYEYEKQFAFLIRMFGKDARANDIKRDHMLFVVDVMQQLPIRTIGKCSANNYQKIIKSGTQTKKKRLAVKTINNYIDFYSNVFKYAQETGLIKTAPTYSIRLKDPEGNDEKRAVFSVADLKKIFHMPLYTDNKRGHRFWIVLLAFWTGMRQNEICCLTSDSIQKIDGIDIINLKVSSKERHERKLKTKAARRIIPIHEELKRIGFMEYVMEQKKANNKWLFPDITIAASGSRSANFQKWADRFIRAASVKRDKVTFHSSRHTFRKAMLEARISAEYRRMLGGWEDKNASTENDYGDEHIARILNEEIQKVKYEGLDLSHLYVE